MTHLPPDHPDSPASPFAPFQPAAGVVADDVPDWQNPRGGPKAADISKEIAKVLRKNRTDEVEDAEKAALESQRLQEEHEANRDENAAVQVDPSKGTAAPVKSARK